MDSATTNTPRSKNGRNARQWSGGCLHSTPGRGGGVFQPVFFRETPRRDPVCTSRKSTRDADGTASTDATEVPDPTSTRLSAKNGNARDVSRILSWNISRGLLKKLKEIEQVINDNNAQVAFIAEVDADENLADVTIPGYETVIAQPKINGKVRIMAFVNTNLNFKVRSDIMSKDLSTIWIEVIRDQQKNVLCGGIYREWTGGLEEPEDLKRLCSQVKTAAQEEKPLILIGDTNFDADQWDETNYRCKSLADVWRREIAWRGLVQYQLGVTYVSYYTKSSGKKVESALDHIYTNDTKTFTNEFKLPNNGMSDHCPILCDMKLNKEKVQVKKDIYILRRSWKTFSNEKFIQDLANQPWQEVIDPKKTVHDQAHEFDRILEETLERHAPLRRTKVRENFRNGLSEKTKQLMKERDHLRHDVRKCKDDTKKEVLSIKLKKARNAVTSRIRKESKMATLKSLKESGNPSEYWKAAKNVTKSAGNPQLKLEEAGTTIDDEDLLSDTFNKYFKEKIEDIEKKIPNLNVEATEKLQDKMREKNLKFSLKTVTFAQVQKAIKSMKNKTSSGIDFVSPKIVKIAMEVITTPLTWVINNSILDGEFPNSWKIAKVIPIFKNKGSKTDKTMYRPVSNLKSVTKVIELLVNKQVLNFFESHKLFPESQHGFRGKRSTFSAVASMHEKWLENQEKKENQSLTFLDLSAAFDTLSKEIFCEKMKMYGFDEKSVKWFCSYLTGRSQRVMIGSTISEPVTLTVGSPQGAILSPTIFILLVSDIELWTEATVCGYADDTSCTDSDKNINAIKPKCEESVRGLLDYMAVNRLSANHDKTHILVVRCGKNEPEKLTFQVGEKQIVERAHEKLLGMWVSNDLKWAHHLSVLERKLNHRLFTLRRIEQVVPRSLLKKVADGIFMSKLRYGLAIFWPVRYEDSDPHPTAVHGIKVVFNRMLRILCGTIKEDRMSVEKMLKKLGWLSINQMAAEVRLIEVWKALNLDTSLSKLFEKVQGTTRAASQNRIKQGTYSKLRESSFLYPSCKLWNRAPMSVVEAKSESDARKQIRSFVKGLPI